LTRISSTNPLERLIGEIKRRTDVMGILPIEAAIVRVVGALLLETRQPGDPCAFGHSDQLRLPAVAA
jgi:transposase-like protein